MRLAVQRCVAETGIAYAWSLQVSCLLLAIAEATRGHRGELTAASAALPSSDLLPSGFRVLPCAVAPQAHAAILRRV